MSILTQTYDALYTTILKALNLDKLNPQEFLFSENGFLSGVDIMNTNQAISNNNIYRIGNAIPADSISYAPAGDLITSYALFLDNLIPDNLDKTTKDNYSTSIQNKIKLDNEITKLKSSEDNNKLESDTRYANLLAQLQATMNNLHSMNNALLGLSTDDEADKDQASPLFTAMGMVSYLSGARKIDGANKYNMKVQPNSDPGSQTYSPKYEIANLSSFFSDWLKFANKNYYPYAFDIDSNAPIQKITTPLGDQESSFGIVPQLTDYTQSGMTIGEYKIKAQLTGLVNVPVQPVYWFEPQFFRMEGYSLRKDAPAFFGKGGSLQLVPIQVILGYNVALKYELTESGFKTIQQALSELSGDKDSGFAIGSLQIFPQGNRKNFEVKTSEENNTLSLKPVNNGIPLLLGTISRRTDYYIANPSLRFHDLK